MTEKLLQFIWQYQYFTILHLQTDNEENLQIIHPGKINYNQGPDFLDARIKINNILLAGNIELHIHASDWEKHQHNTDTNFSNIILHVVWINDTKQKTTQTSIPILVLEDKVTKILLYKYEQLMNNITVIKCKKNLSIVHELIWINWKERLAIERLQQKSEKILHYLTESNQHWEEVFWWMIARNFGTKVNGDFFEQIAKSISINTLAKHKNQIHQLEALLLGQANLLTESFTETYPQQLAKEYTFLAKKYTLSKLHQQPYFLRMRPANFPTIRLAQLAMLIHQSAHIFSAIKEADALKNIQQIFQVTANNYWSTHFIINETSAYQQKKIGEDMIKNIIINTVVPIVFTYGIYTHNEYYKTKSLQWLSELKAENNAIINEWKSNSITCNSALESQALLQLYQHYCSNKKCLDCAVGNKLLQPTNER